MNSRPSPVVLSSEDQHVEVSGFVLTRTYRPPRLVLPPHFHEHANIAFAVEGSFIETIGLKPYEVHPRSVIFRPAGERHSNRYGKNAAQSLIIEVGPQRLAQMQQVTGILNHASYVQAGPISHLALRILGEFGMLDAVAPLAIEALILEMLVQTARLGSAPEGNPPPWLRQAKELIHEEFVQSLSLSSVAEAVGVHPAHLAKMFRKQYGCTLGDYVRRLRLDYASQLLARPEKSLTTIALATGFYDQSHFARLFKLRFGVTPGAFRASMKTRKGAILPNHKDSPSD